MYSIVLTALKVTAPVASINWLMVSRYGKYTPHRFDMYPINRFIPGGTEKYKIDSLL